jgi:hypothetical protein
LLKRCVVLCVWTWQLGKVSQSRCKHACSRGLTYQSLLKQLAPTPLENLYMRLHDLYQS